MTKEQYEAWSRPYRDRPWLIGLIKVANKLLTLSGFIAYPLLILILAISCMQSKDALSLKRLLIYLLIPGISFVFLSVYRKIANKKRPYEALDIKPLIAREKKGQSFPSRHIFSICLIASCWLGICPAIGILLLLFGGILAYIRVIGGIHYPLDVFCGASIGILCGLLTIFFA